MNKFRHEFHLSKKKNIDTYVSPCFRYVELVSRICSHFSITRLIYIYIYVCLPACLSLSLSLFIYIYIYIHMIYFFCEIFRLSPKQSRWTTPC
jgi:hypothetical protein